MPRHNTSVTNKCIPIRFDQRLNVALYDINISYGSLLAICCKTGSITPVFLVDRVSATGGRASHFLISTSFIPLMQREQLKLGWAWLMEVHLLPSGSLWTACIRLKLKTRLTDEAMTVVTFPDVDISCQIRHCPCRHLLTNPFCTAFQFERWIWGGVIWQSVTVGNYRVGFTQVRLDHVKLQICDWQ